MSTPTPSLQSVAEAAAKAIREIGPPLTAWPGWNGAIVANEITDHFAPLLAQYEQRVREREKERHKMCARVERGEFSEDCPFCLAKHMSPGVASPMCHLCDLESRDESLRADLAALRTRCAELEEDKAKCNNSVIEASLAFPNVGEYITQLETQLETARSLLSSAVKYVPPGAFKGCIINKPLDEVRLTKQINTFLSQGSAARTKETTP